MSDQTILGKKIEGAKTLHDEALRAMAAFRSGVYAEVRFTIAASENNDLSTLTPDTVDGSNPDNILTKESEIERAHLVIIRFDKDIIVRFNNGDPIEVFVADGGILQEEVLEVTKIEVKTTDTIPSPAPPSDPDRGHRFGRDRLRPRGSHYNRGGRRRSFNSTQEANRPEWIAYG